MTLTSDESARLESFRRAARQVREASIIAEGRRLEIRTVPDEAGYVEVFVRLLGDEPFRSLALAIRLVYQQSEPAHFDSICSLLYREGTEEVKTKVAALRAQYRQALQGPRGELTVGTDTETHTFTTQEVFDHWLYGVAFHQDSNRQRAVRLLASEGARFIWSVQATSLQLAGRILDLDDIVADLLGGEHLPRIQTTTPRQ